MQKLHPLLYLSVVLSLAFTVPVKHYYMAFEGVPNNKTVAFAGVRVPQKELYQYLHKQGISCILGTMGNLNQKAKSTTQPIYAQLVTDGADILSTDALELAGRQLDVYRKTNKMELKNIIVK